MKPRLYLCWLTVLAVCALARTDMARAVDAFSDVAPQEGLLVLANGSVIEGMIAREGEYYRVLLPKGRLQVRADQVDFLCRSKEEAYVRRRARKISTTSTVEVHLEMARWCVQQELFAYAVAEIEDARQLESQHRQIPLVERLLSQRKELALRRQKAVVRDEQISTASANLEQPRPATADVPAWARTEFIKRVQPMLVNSCATAGCHVPNSPQRFEIDRTALDGVGNPELFQRNLAAVMEMVNLPEPESSPMLAMGAAVHGTELAVQSRPLTLHQVEILRAWITQLALDEPPHEEKPRIAQIVIGMNSSTQQRPVLSVQSPDAAQDPFDPAAFNTEHAVSNDDSADTAETTPSETPSQSVQE